MRKTEQFKRRKLNSFSKTKIDYSKSGSITGGGISSGGFMEDIIIKDDIVILWQPASEV